MQNYDLIRELTMCSNNVHIWAVKLIYISAGVVRILDNTCTVISCCFFLTTGNKDRLSKIKTLNVYKKIAETTYAIMRNYNDNCGFGFNSKF